MSKTQILIRNIEELRTLTTNHSQKGAIRLAVNALKPSESQYWETQLNRLYHSCGCETGTIVSFLSASIYVSYLFLRDVGLTIFIWKEFLIGVAILFLSAGVGKLVGLKLANMQLRRKVERLISMVD